MNTFLPSVKHLFTLLFLLLFIPFSCTEKKEVEPDIPLAASISSETLQLKGYEAGLLNVSNYQLTESEYELDFGGKKIKALKNADNSLSFLAPGDLISGTYSVKAGFADNSLQITLTAPELIADPSAYVVELIGNTSERLQDYLDATGS